MPVEQVADPFDHGAQLVGGRLVPQPHDWMKPELVPRREGLEACIRDLTVGDADDGAIEGANTRRTQADVVDRAESLPHLQNVSDAHGLVEDQRGARDDVLEGLLGGEGHRDASHAESSQHRSRVHAEAPKRDEDTCEDHQQIDDPARDAKQ